MHIFEWLLSIAWPVHGYRMVATWKRAAQNYELLSPLGPVECVNSTFPTPVAVWLNRLRWPPKGKLGALQWLPALFHFPIRAPFHQWGKVSVATCCTIDWPMFWPHNSFPSQLIAINSVALVTGLTSQSIILYTTPSIFFFFKILQKLHMAFVENNLFDVKTRKTP